MRRVLRVALDARTTAYLLKRQGRVDAGQAVEQAWKTARATKAMGRVRSTLVSMVGVRERCFFCEDSRGSDIEHFWPKVPHPNRAFLWDNLLLLCATCNRKKGDRFPLDAHGNPILVNPAVDDPWQFIFFDEITGNLVARVVGGVPDPRGEVTCDPSILPLNLEATAEGRLRTVRRLRKAVADFLRDAPISEPVARTQLVTEIADVDAQGLVRWYFLHDGQHVAPFAAMRVGYVGTWAHVVGTL